MPLISKMQAGLSGMMKQTVIMGIGKHCLAYHCNQDHRRPARNAKSCWRMINRFHRYVSYCIRRIWKESFNAWGYVIYGNIKKPAESHLLSVPSKIVYAAFLDGCPLPLLGPIILLQGYCALIWNIQHAFPKQSPFVASSIWKGNWISAMASYGFSNWYSTANIVAFCAVVSFQHRHFARLQLKSARCLGKYLINI